MYLIFCYPNDENVSFFRWAVDVPQRHIFRRMSSIADTLIAIVQLTSTSDKNKNLKTAKNLIADSAAIGAKVRKLWIIQVLQKSVVDHFIGC